MLTMNASTAAGSSLLYARAVAPNRDDQIVQAWTERVTLSSGKPFSLKKVERIVIGPAEKYTEMYTSSSATKEALIKNVDPVMIGFGVSRLRYGPKNTVIVEGCSLNPGKFQKCQEFHDAGLEIQQGNKLLPRIAIRDIPVDFPEDKICGTIIAQNLPDASPSNLKLVYIYPSGTKKHRSCIVELKAEHRATLIRKKKSQHRLTVLSNCEHKTVCGKCASDHETRVCPIREKTELRCVNCIKAKSTNVCQAATDRALCPILRKKIKYRISIIDYGDV
ncbi:hypothetical protein TKK_0017287 [Trichogramma kaykai]